MRNRVRVQAPPEGPGAPRLSRLRHIRDALSRHPIAVKLPLAFDAERMRRDLARIEESWWARHRGPYHNGLWETVALWAPGGDRSCQVSFGAPFGPTEALRRAPCLEEVMESIPGEKSRVRLMRLGPGGHIRRHSDPVHRVGHGSVRIHVPVTTADSVFFLVDGRRVRMEPGEAWQVDVRFPHEVRNFGKTGRVHLVVDAHASPEYAELASRGEPAGDGLLTRYYLAHALPAPARRALKIGN